MSDYVLKTNLLRLGMAVRRAMNDARVRERERDFEARIHHLSHYDALTDLPNLTHVAGLAKQAIARVPQPEAHGGIGDPEPRPIPAHRSGFRAQRRR